MNSRSPSSAAASWSVRSSTGVAPHPTRGCHRALPAWPNRDPPRSFGPGRPASEDQRGGLPGRRPPGPRHRPAASALCGRVRRRSPARPPASGSSQPPVAPEPHHQGQQMRIGRGLVPTSAPRSPSSVSLAAAQGHAGLGGGASFRSVPRAWAVTPRGDGAGWSPPRESGSNAGVGTVCWYVDQLARAQLNAPERRPRLMPAS